MNSVKRLILAIVLLIGFSGTAMAGSDFYTSGIRMGTTTCSDTNFECENLSSQQKEITAAANECVKADFIMNDASLSDFRQSGEFENCVLSDRPSKDARGVNNYAICCIKKNAAANTCNMTCTRYIDQK